jgi:hypothetical protein
MAAGNQYTPAISSYNSGSADLNSFFSKLQQGQLKMDAETQYDDSGSIGVSVPMVSDASGNRILNANIRSLGPGVAEVTMYGGGTSQRYYLNYDTKTGYLQPVQDYNKQVATVGSGGGGGLFGGILGDIIGGVSSIIKDLGPIGQMGLIYATGGLGSALAAELGVSSAVGTALASAGIQVAQGVPIEAALTNAAVSSIGGTASNAVNTIVDEVGAATNYGTDIGSQQTAMLAAQDAGLLTPGDVAGTAAGKLAGSTIAGVLAGQDLGTAATTGAINAGANLVSSALTTPTTTEVPQTAETPDIFTDTTAASVPEQPLASSVDQEQTSGVIPDGNVDAQGNPTYVDQQGNPVDVSGTAIPGANERTPLEGGGFKTLNPDGSITYEDPDGSVYKVNLDGTYTTESLGTTSTYNPATETFTQPTTETTTETQTQPTSTGGLTQQQLENILKAGAGLLTGAAVVNAVTGGTTTPTSTSTQTTTPTPTTTTAAATGTGPYSADYFQQIQQNYNRLFPTAPADIATPLQSWYATKYVPDTSISQKLFGV